MAVTTGYEQVAAVDGSGSFAAYRAVPASGRGPGVLVFQEIFGINDNMRGLAERLAEAGYVALVPDMFWRIEPRFERKDESGMADAFAMMQRFDRVAAGADVAAALGHLRSMPECTGRVGAVGFCLGGTLTYACAVHADPDVAVSYYGSGIHEMLDGVTAIACPIMFHYGNDDPFIPEEQIAAVEAAVAGRPGVEFHRYAAGHAFSNWDAPSMYQQHAADLAWGRTLAFLSQHLGG